MELAPKIARDFIGDIGINLKLAYDLIKPGIGPLSPSKVISVHHAIRRGWWNLASGFAEKS
jgi:aldehyde:ferredoxin oxidoreductase